MERLPCPFCGSRKIAKNPVRLDMVEGKDVLCLECDTCEAWGPLARGEYIDDAEAVWNLRDVMTSELSLLFRGFTGPWDNKPIGAKEVSDVTPCPFCSATTVCVEECGVRAEDDSWVAMCTNCECSGPVDSEPGQEAALKRWKRRAVA